MRTDDNNNPTAFTTDIAKEAGLIERTDYVQGDQFPNGEPYYTAKLLHDPIELTIQVINKIGFFNDQGKPRWTYIAIPYQLWKNLTGLQKTWVIGWMYRREGGTKMVDMFPVSLD